MRPILKKPKKLAPASAKASPTTGAEGESLRSGRKKTKAPKVSNTVKATEKEGEKLASNVTGENKNDGGKRDKSKRRSSFSDKKGKNIQSEGASKPATESEPARPASLKEKKKKTKKNSDRDVSQDNVNETQGISIGKGGRKGANAPVVNKFSFKANEQPVSVKRKKKENKDNSNRSGRNIDTQHSTEDGENGATENEEAETPDIKFQKRMTKDKLSLLTRSPLSHLLTQKEKDAAAEEVYGKGTKFSMQGKRKMDDVEVDEVIPLDSTKPPKKKSKSDANSDAMDPVKVAARRKETRKLKRKIRQLRARGELPDEEKEAPEVGVVYLGHIPHGFYENEMRGYFSQFGEVTRVRLSRSKKTARSRGFAYIEFADSEVATKAAESMDGYLMHGQKLVAKLVPPEKVHPETFKGANRVFRKIPFSAIERRAMIQRSRDPMKLAQRSKGVQKRLEDKREKLARLGIKYEFPTVASTAES